MLSFNPIMVESYAALFNCTAVVQASDSKRVRREALCKLTQISNATNIFPHHFFHVAMIGIIWIYFAFFSVDLVIAINIFKYIFYFWSPLYIMHMHVVRSNQEAYQ